MTLPFMKTQLMKVLLGCVKYDIFCGIILAGDKLFVIKAVTVQWYSMLRNRVTDLSYLGPAHCPNLATAIQ